ncbi:hypothetical protein HMPREF9065_00456 [Aggregatibacter sp. oral taxon 458 str. W10330]|nr:hypothetical protein HMPREF9065_00456 [Aggregatibacter sp. oral taxon 458 str. W10330]
MRNYNTQGTTFTRAIRSIIDRNEKQSAVYFSIIFNNKKISEKYLLLSVISCY